MSDGPEILCTVPDEYGEIVKLAQDKDGNLVASTSSGRDYVVRKELLRRKGEMARA